MIVKQNKLRFGNRMKPEQHAVARERQADRLRNADMPITLPSVGAAYAFHEGRLLRDGEPQPVRVR